MPPSAGFTFPYVCVYAYMSVKWEHVNKTYLWSHGREHDQRWNEL